MKTVKPKQMKNTTKTRTKCLLDSVYNRIGANLWEAEESTELAISRISKKKKNPNHYPFLHKENQTNLCGNM